jgi:hypothetical protein
LSGILLVSRASATLPRAAATSGRLRGVFSCDTGDGRWPNVDAFSESVFVSDAIREYVLVSNASAFPIVVPVGGRFDLAIGEPLDLAIAVSDRRHSSSESRSGDGRAEPDARSRGGARGGGKSPRS